MEGRGLRAGVAGGGRAGDSWRWGGDSARRRVSAVAGPSRRPVEVWGDGDVPRAAPGCSVGYGSAGRRPEDPSNTKRKKTVLVSHPNKKKKL